MSKMIINTEWYRMFLYTAKLGNVTRAAEELNVTQPSVSYAIKQLETMLGVKLFDRFSKGVALTSEGASLLEYVEKSFRLLDAGESKLKSLKKFESGELRIGASGPIIKHLLLPSLDDFHAAYPGVRIRLSQAKTSEIAARLKDGQIDLGIVHLPVIDDDLDIQPLVAIQDCFVVGHAYRELAEHPIEPGVLKTIPLLLLSQGSSTRLYIEQWLNAHGCAAEADIELSSLDMLVELACRGYGTAFVTRSFVAEDLAEGKLFELQLTEQIPPRMIGLAARRGTSLPLIADRFKALLTSSVVSSTYEGAHLHEKKGDHRR